MVKSATAEELSQICEENMTEATLTFMANGRSIGAYYTECSRLAIEAIYGEDLTPSEKQDRHGEALRAILEQKGKQYKALADKYNRDTMQIFDDFARRIRTTDGKFDKLIKQQRKQLKKSVDNDRRRFLSFLQQSHKSTLLEHEMFAAHIKAGKCPMKLLQDNVDNLERQSAALRALRGL